MSNKLVPLYFTPGGAWVFLREISGYDEQLVEDTGTIDAIRLLDRLMDAVPGTDIGPGKAKVLTTADRDRLLAAVYMRAYGSRIESTVHCINCNAPFDLDFSLDEMVNHLNSETDTIKAEKGLDGTFKLPDGRTFRLPTGEDECAVLGLSLMEAENEMLKRCIVKGDPARDAESLQNIMKEMAPTLDLNLEALCPECQREQMVHFDIQCFLLSTIKQEQKQLAYEVHRVAGAYGWSLSEILELPRSLRRAFVELVESEQESWQRRYA